MIHTVRSSDSEPPSRWIQTEKITEIPGLLIDLAEFRREPAGYYTNFRRLEAMKTNLIC
jgi:hypothetical protein